MSIIFIKHFYLKGLVNPHYSTLSQMMFTLIALMCLNDVDLNVLNKEGKSVLEVIEAEQRVIDA